MFVDEQGYTKEQEDDGLDAECDHFLALDAQGQPLGTLRYFSPPKSKVGRLGKSQLQLRSLRIAADYTLAAVLKAGRGTGAGAALLAALEQMVTERYGKGTPISLASQIHAIPFYAKSGYTARGDIFEEDGQPHQQCVKQST